MIRPDYVDRALVDWIAEQDRTRANYLDEVLARTARTPQRPAWSFPGRWLPKPRPAMGEVDGGKRPRYADDSMAAGRRRTVLAAGLSALLVASTAWIGARMSEIASPRPAATATASPSGVRHPELSHPFVSDVHAYSVRTPEDWIVAQRGTPWPRDLAPEIPLHWVMDRLRGESGEFAGGSQQLRAGETSTDWLRRYCEPTPGTFICVGSPGQWPDRWDDVTIGDEVGWRVSPGVAAVVANGRGYVFVTSSVDEALAGAILASVEFTDAARVSPVPVRAEPAGGAGNVLERLVVSDDTWINVNDTIGDAAGRGWLDITGVDVRSSSEPFGTNMFMSLRLHEPLQQIPSRNERRIAYAVVIDANGDGIGECALGADNGVSPPSARWEWTMDITTGESTVNAGPTSGMAGCGYGFESWYRGGWFGPESDFALSVGQTDPGRGLRFYAVAFETGASGVVAVDYAPDSGWIDLEPSAYR